MLHIHISFKTTHALATEDLVDDTERELDLRGLVSVMGCVEVLVWQEKHIDGK